MQLSFQIPLPNQYWDAMHASEKTGFSLIFSKSLSAENFRRPKISAPVNYVVANADKQKAKGSLINFCQKRASKLRNA